MRPIVDGLKEDLKGKASFLALNMDDGAGEAVAKKHKIPPGGFVVFNAEGEEVLTSGLPHKKSILEAVKQASPEGKGKAYFDGVAKDWDELRKAMFSERVRDFMVKESHVTLDSVVVDVGCGTGFLSKGFVGIAHQVIGVDSSEEMLTQARNNLYQAKNFETRLGTAETIPLEDGMADLVVGNMILHHCPNPLAAIKEMARVLKHGGRLFLTDLDKHEHEEVREEHKDLWLGFDREDLKKRFELAGLKSVEVKGTDESCCTTSSCGGEIKVSIFLARGTKP
jgi:ubiquinone/menaquinone biosynthesis C-methylase UbiE